MYLFDPGDFVYFINLLIIPTFVDVELNDYRDYLGEKISFYFAWVGTLIASLVIPAVIGFCVFFYGVVQK